MRTPTINALLAPCLLLLLLALAPRAGYPASAVSSFQGILVDGDFADWGPVAAAYVDPSGDNGAAPADLGTVWIANDEIYVYVRFEIGFLLNAQGLGAALLVHFDTDNSASTGFQVGGIGADLSYQFSPGGGSGSRAYEGAPGNDQASDLGHGAIGAYALPTVASTEFELRMRRDTFLPLQGKPAFTGPDFRLVIEAESPGGSQDDLAPDAPGGILYTFASGTPLAPPDNDLARVDPHHVRVMSYNIKNDGLFNGGNQARLTRIFQAVGPDVVGIQEVWSHTAQDVADWFDVALPLGGGATWFAAKGSRNQVTVSRWPLVVHTQGPSGELSTLVDLPDADYVHDLYLIDSHFKCCGTIGDSNDQKRQAAADAIIDWIRDLQNPGGLATLAAGTPTVQVGDLNMVGGPQPLLTLLTGNIIDNATFGPDYPPDWDGSDNEHAGPIHSDTRTFYTWRNDASSFAPGKLDYIIYTGSAVGPGNRFVLETMDMPASKLSALGLQADDTHLASDHLPVIQDFEPDPGSSTGSRGGLPPSSRIDSVVPNPFNPNTNVLFSLDRRAPARLAVYDVRGALVRDLLRRTLEAGRHRVAWDGRDGRSALVASGVYYVLLEVDAEAGLETSSYKMVLLK